MTNVRLAFLVLLLLVGCSRFRGEPASLDDIAKVVEALRGAGCTAVREIDVDSDGFEVEGATCNDGKSYDINSTRSSPSSLSARTGSREIHPFASYTPSKAVSIGQQLSRSEPMRQLLILT